MSDLTSPLLTMQRYCDILISPVAQLLASPGGGREHCAGPVYPDFEQQGAARHCRGNGPIDHCPPVPPPAQPIPVLDETLLWGGCLVAHFGHFTAEFIHRLLPSVQACPDLRILYVTSPGEASKPWPAFIQAIFEYLGVADRILVLDRYTRVKTLLVMPQQECLGGRHAPSAEYLAQLRARQALLPAVPAQQEGGVLFVSRGRVGKGLLAEWALDEFFESLGAKIFHPELHSLEAQLAAYLSHASVVFSEGSALHGLQLLGSVPADVAVLVRRPGRFGEVFLTPRVRSLRYVSVNGPAVYCESMDGHEARWDGLVFIETSQLHALAQSLFPTLPEARIEEALGVLQQALHAAEQPAVRQILSEKRHNRFWANSARLQRSLAKLQRFPLGVRMSFSAALAGVSLQDQGDGCESQCIDVRAMRSSTAPTAWLALLAQVAAGDLDLGYWRAQRPLATLEWIRSDLETGIVLCLLHGPGQARLDLSFIALNLLREPARWQAYQAMLRRLVLLWVACPGRVRVDHQLSLDEALAEALRSSALPTWQRVLVALFYLLPGLDARSGEAEDWAGAMERLAGLPDRQAAELAPEAAAAGLQALEHLSWAEPRPASLSRAWALHAGSPREPAAHAAISRIHQRQGQPLAALSLALAGWLDGDGTAGSAHLAACLGDAGHLAAAHQFWRLACRQHPDRPQYAHAMYAISQRLLASRMAAAAIAQPVVPQTEHRDDTDGA